MPEAKKQSNMTQAGFRRSALIAACDLGIQFNYATNIFRSALRATFLS
jgi:hypothetical protein